MVDTQAGVTLITPRPALTSFRPGSVPMPIFGVEPGLLDQEGNERDTDNHNLIAPARTICSTSQATASAPQKRRGTIGHAAVVGAVVVASARVKGQLTSTAMTLMARGESSADTRGEITPDMRCHISPQAVLDRIQFAHALRNTRSGKTMCPSRAESPSLVLQRGVTVSSARTNTL